MEKAGNNRLRPWQILKKGPQFRAVFKSRLRISSECMIIHACKNNCGHDRIGLAVSRKIGNAVRRNLAKRRLREVFRTNTSTEEPFIDCVVRPTPGFLDIPYHRLESNWRAALKSAKNRL